MNVKLIPSTITEPLSLNEIKKYLRIDSSFTEDDSDLQSFITVARDHIEQGILNRSVVIKDFEMTIERFENEIEIPIIPLIGVNSITYKDIEGVTHTLDPSNYIVNTDYEPGSVTLKSIPTFEAYQKAPIKIRFKAGYDNPPEVCKQAIKLLVSHMYDNRELVSDQKLYETPITVKYLLAPYTNKRWV